MKKLGIIWDELGYSTGEAKIEYFKIESA